MTTSTTRIGAAAIVGRLWMDAFEPLDNAHGLHNAAWLLKQVRADPRELAQALEIRLRDHAEREELCVACLLRDGAEARLVAEPENRGAATCERCGAIPDGRVC